MTDHLLVGDVGGTNVRFARAHGPESGFHLEGFRKYAGEDFTGFDLAVARYLEETGVRPEAALFALAGPLKNGAVKLTNRAGWPAVSGAELTARFGVPVRVVNDFTAMARGVPELSEDAFEAILPARAAMDEDERAARPVIVMGPGTGLGLATLLPEPGGRWRVLPGEGGFIAYAPQDDRERELARLLMAETDFLSDELVMSGAGFEMVWRGVCRMHGVPYEPATPAEVLDRALEGEAAPLEFCRIRARAICGAAGDAALMVGAGRVVLAGGVATRLAPFLKAEEAEARFRHRGPRTEDMAPIAVDLVHAQTTPLIGAAALYADAAHAPPPAHP